MAEKKTKKTPPKATKKQKEKYRLPEGFHKAVPIILFAVAIFTGVCFIINDLGAFGNFLSDFLLGMFSYGAYSIPVLLALHAIFYPSDRREKRLLSRIIFSVVAVVALSSMAYAISYWRQDVDFLGTQYYSDGAQRVGGGLVGSITAYLLIKLFGYIGLIIIALAVLAIYVTFFFSKGERTLSRIGLNILKGVVIACAYAERKIKRLVSEVKSAKDKKQRRISEQKSAELYEDEFFDVDNGIERLEISELGIMETRSTESIESNPTLHEKVFHKSALSEEEAREYERRKNAQRESYVYEPSANDVYTPKKRVVDSGFGIDGNGLDSYVDRDINRSTEDIIIDIDESDAGLDTSADRVFTKDFDPFGMVMSDELANKPSSRSLLDETPSVTEDLSELTEEDVERAKKIADFERRKAHILNNQRATAIPVNNSGEFTGTQKTVEFKETTTEQIKTVDEDSATVSVKIEKTEQQQNGFTENYQSYTSLGFGEDTEPRYRESEETISFKRETPAKVAEESVSTDTYPIAEKTDEPVQRHADTSYEDTYRRAAQFTRAAIVTENEAASAKSNTDKELNESFTVGREETRYYQSSPVREDMFAPEFKPYGVTDSETSMDRGLVFEFDGESDVQEIKVEAEEPKTITVERSMLRSDYTDEKTAGEEETEALSFPEEESCKFTDGEEIPNEEDTEDEDCTFDTDADEAEVADEEEIPPEEQNPKVSEFRDMFTMFRNSENEEESSNNEEEDTQDDYSADASLDNCTEDEEPEDGHAEDGEDAPPFDTPSYSAPKTSVGSIDDLVAKPKDEKPEKKKADYSNYVIPPIDLLGLDEVQNDEEINAEINQNTNTLIETLASFNVTASIKGVDRGPRITRYEVVPARGVKVNAITNLFDDIALNLAAEGIRMEAPIPGKSAIGFEIPNKRPSNVRLRELLECEEFISAKSKTIVCIGKDVAGNPVFGDIAKFPHALVAGATGMGKSVCINSIMISMLYKARPDEVKFIMIDPKKVEFRMYSGIPHLLIPVITEAKQAAGALMWAVEEMERRYSLIEKLNIRTIESYNEKCAIDKSIGEPMPKIVIVIDELNDLMMQVRDPVEDLIMRIAQKARAAGIHLIIGTQRPDVKVVTGTIKANINTRISCKVSSVVDSRTILEMAGAEKLLNKGDMLFKPVDKTKPIRVQGCFVSDPEVEAIMDFLKNEVSGEHYDEEIFAEINKAAQKCGNKKSSGGMDDDMGDGDGECGYYNDQQFLDAVELAIRSGKVSTSLLQRKLSIGYGKAAKFIDAMEEIGIVSEQNGQKPRDVLLSIDEWHEKLTRVNFE